MPGAGPPEWLLAASWPRHGSSSLKLSQYQLLHAFLPVELQYTYSESSIPEESTPVPVNP
ncbi:uncharacterized protein CIMG_12832 [Coccidioides immitis RS]|uniref:Uncharacterized protein n=1 Tax=Coccidioides immitis (strain RS) TaxID=246410 RepID=A0A0D8JTH6_COCIM|nr:uncharacterized protein CIMG_12832 [Coccidioides immitis RS]KJF60261.1 hypothetical protein CIMG_12832 [Coccidioides immitis RS]